MLLNGPDNPRKLLLPLVGSAPPLTKFLRPTRVFTLNGISIRFLHSSPQNVPLLYNGLLRFPQNCPFPLGSGPPSNTRYLGPPESSSKRHRDRYSRFCMGPKCYAEQCIVSGEKTPKLPLPLGFRHPAGEGPSHGHRQHAQKLVLYGD